MIQLSSQQVFIWILRNSNHSGPRQPVHRTNRTISVDLARSMFSHPRSMRVSSRQNCAFGDERSVALSVGPTNPF